VATSPFPDGALRSPKALKVLGLPPEAGAENVSRSYKGEGDDAGLFQIVVADSARTVRKAASNPAFIIWLTRGQEVVPEQSNESAEAGAAASASRRFKATNKKALRMLDLLPSRGNRPKSAGRDSIGSPDTEQRHKEQGDHEATHLSDGCPRLRSEGRRFGPRSKGRNRRKKTAKSLERMDKIEEADSLEHEDEDEDEDGGDYEEENAELDVISEYDTFKMKTASFERSVTAPLFPRIQFEESGVDNEDQGYDGEPEEDTDEKGKSQAVTHIKTYPQVSELSSDEPLPVYDTPAADTAGSRHDVVLTHNGSPDMLPINSPLQHIEQVLLNNTREKMNMDLAKSRLYRDHTSMKTRLGDLKRRSLIPFENNVCIWEGQDGQPTRYPCAGYRVPSDDELEYLETESDDEAAILTAETIPLRRFTSGSAKLVDIPPRIPLGTSGSNRLETPQAEISHVAHLREVIREGEHGTRSSKFDAAKCGTIASRTQNALEIPVLHCNGEVNGGSNIHVRGLTHHLQSHQLSPASPYQSSQFDYEKGKRARFPREQSQSLVAGWIASGSSSASRPLSESLDLDVLADRSLDRAPTPPPKDSSRIAGRSTSLKHHCVSNGHIFSPLDLEYAAGNIGIGRLRTRPFFQTREGNMEHVSVPVQCENCDKKCDRNIWQCSVPVCHLVVCDACATKREAERKRLAVDSWENRKKRGY
jgi:hypothetical protein